MNNKTIPVFFGFNKNYVIPAAVTFYSLLKNADAHYHYKLYVLHADIDDARQAKLKKVVNGFKNAELSFIRMNSEVDMIWEQIDVKGHYSKECLYKLLASSIFKEYDRIICTDVDVVFVGDISVTYNNSALDVNYIAGVRAPGKLYRFLGNCYSDVPECDQDIIRNGVGAGYLVYNLKKIRDDKLELKFIENLRTRSKSIKQPEQDVLNYVCLPKICYLPLTYCFCTYMYNTYGEKDPAQVRVSGNLFNYIFKRYRHNLKGDTVYSENELMQAFSQPVQIHFATNVKPWNRVFTKKKLLWLHYLLKTPFKIEYILKYELKNLVNRMFYRHFRRCWDMSNSI